MYGATAGAQGTLKRKVSTGVSRVSGVCFCVLFPFVHRERVKGDERGITPTLPPHLREQFPAEYELYDTLCEMNAAVDARVAKSTHLWQTLFARKREGGLGKV